MNLKKAAQKKLRKSGGFTLVEMLIVVAIIAILVVVSIPMVSSSLDKARTATDDANERAAKAAAQIQYMTDELTTGEVYYYNASSGKANPLDADTAATGEGYTYGQTSAHEDGCVKVTVQADGTIADGGVQWVNVKSDT